MNKFKSKEPNQIMALLLETEIENIPVIINVYNNLKKIIANKTYKNTNDLLNTINNNLYKFNFYNEKTTGIKGLKRMLQRWKTGLTNSKLMLEIINDWMNYVKDALDKYKKMTDKNYMYESNNILKPKSSNEINKIMQTVSINQYTDIIVRMIDKLMGYLFSSIYDIENEDYFYSILNKNYNKKIAPDKTAKELIYKYYKNKWKPDKVITINDEPYQIKYIGYDKTKNRVEIRKNNEIVPKIIELEK